MLTLDATSLRRLAAVAGRGDRATDVSEWTQIESTLIVSFIGSSPSP
jgi:hypothetical protein